MRPKVKKVIKDAHRLTGAQARYISLVDEGANETPFLEIKSKTGDKTMPIKKRGTPPTKATKSHKPVVTGRKAKSDDAKTENRIAKLTYSKKHFEDEAAVEEHITKSDWEGDYTITETDDAFEVTPDGLDADLIVKSADVDTDDKGVTATVASVKVAKADDGEAEEEGDEDDTTETKAKKPATKSALAKAAEELGDEDDDEDDDAASGDDEEAEDEESEEAKATAKKQKAPAKKTAAPLSKRAAFLKKRKEEAPKTSEKKFSYWDAYDSFDADFVKVLKDGMSDGVPPGVDELMYCMTSSLRNTLGDEKLSTEEKSAALTKSANAFASTIAKLDGLFEAIISDETALQKRVPKDEQELVEKFVERYADWLNTEAEQVETKSVKKVSKKSASSEDSDNDLAETVTKAIDEKLAPIAKVVEKLASRHPVSKSRVSEEVDSEDEQAEKIAKRRESDAEFMRKKTTQGIFG